MPKISPHLDVSSLAREHTGFAVQRLAKLARYAESEPVQMGACIALLDRGWGKPAQTHTGEDGEGDIRIVVRHIISSVRAEQPLKLVEQSKDREVVTPVLPPEGDGAK
jgi:hypothetical protein